MKILIEIPTWLGDAIMTTPAIENLIQNYQNAKITLFGSFVSTEALKAHSNIEKVVVDNTRDKKEGNRVFALKRVAKSLGKFDIALSFRRTITSKIFLFFVKAKKKYHYKRYTKDEIHQVIRYNDFINKIVKKETKPANLKLYYTKIEYKKPTLGINPGATYGSAKRWYPNEFAKVAKALSSEYDIVIFGGASEIEIANDIEKELRKNLVFNVTNLAGKTSIIDLIKHIAGLNLFITNDSGPMHIASVYQILTIAIFGPTKDKETNQWQNPKSKIVKKELECSPCMKRVCPLKHHNCMKMITYKDVLEAIRIIREIT